MEVAKRQCLQEGLSALARGDRDAFTPVFDILWPIYRRFGRKYLSEVDADDAAQEALLKLFSRADEFDPSRDAAAFAIGVAYHEIRTWRRKRWRRREDSVEPEKVSGLSSEPPGAEEALVLREVDEMIEWGLSHLSPDDRETLTLYAHGERAATASPPTFRKRVQRAVGRMRAVLVLR